MPIETSRWEIPHYIMKQCVKNTVFKLPTEDWSDPMKVLTATEQAHWMYEDKFLHNPCYKDLNLKEVRIKRFMKITFDKYQFFWDFHKNFDSLYHQWNEARISTPSYGAALIDTKCEKVLLVKEISKHDSWSFPKGKIEYRGESPRDCAIREVYEETGYDITYKVDENLYMERNIMIFSKDKYVNKLVGIYVIFGVPEKRRFRPETENEICELDWFDLDDMLTPSCPLAESDLFFAKPFLEDLKKIVRNKRKRMAKAKPKVIQPKNNKPKNKNEIKQNMHQDFDTFCDQIRTGNEVVNDYFQNTVKVPFLPPGLPPKAVELSRTAKRRARRRNAVMRNRNENQQLGGEDRPFQIEGQILQIQNQPNTVGNEHQGEDRPFQIEGQLLQTQNQANPIGNQGEDRPFQLLQMQNQAAPIGLENELGAGSEIGRIRLMDDSGIGLAESGIESSPSRNAEELTKGLKKCLKIDTNNDDDDGPRRIPLKGIQNNMN